MMRWEVETRRETLMEPLYNSEQHIQTRHVNVNGHEPHHELPGFHDHVLPGFQERVHLPRALSRTGAWLQQSSASSCLLLLGTRAASLVSAKFSLWIKNEHVVAQCMWVKVVLCACTRKIISIKNIAAVSIFFWHDLCLRRFFNRINLIPLKVCLGRLHNIISNTVGESVNKRQTSYRRLSKGFFFFTCSEQDNFSLYASRQKAWFALRGGSDVQS